MSAHRHVYYIRYRLYRADAERGIAVIASSKCEAYRVAVYEAIPKESGEHPYSAWVKSVTYNNGRSKQFNTFEGKPY